MTGISSPLELRELLGADFTVSDEQWAAISAPLEPTVVIAGAGSGKTELMSARVIYLLANGLVRPDQVLGLTFTTKATAELGERIRKALAITGLDIDPESGSGEAEERLEPTIATYNAYAASLLSEHGLRIGHEPDLRVMADASRYQLAARAIARHQGRVTALSEHPPTVIGYLLALEGSLNEHLVSVAEVRAFQARERPKFAASLEGPGGKAKLKALLEKMSQREELLDLIDGYRALKSEYGLLDFSDQIALACELAMTQPEVGRAERERYKVVLLDEYQDTSVAQARMLSALFSGSTPGDGLGHAVMAVGDPHQAIYGWRGASVSNILRFGEFFPRADGVPVQRLPLTINRRSDRRILELANVLARPLYDAPLTRDVAPLAAKPEAGEGEVRTIVHETHDDELVWLAEEVLRAHARFGEWMQLGVLVRTNAHAAEVFDALSARGIPVEIVGLGGLLRLPEVAEVVSTLTLLEDLTANDALLTLLTGPRWAIGQRDLALLGRRSSELTSARGRPAEGAPRPPVAELLVESVAGVDPTEIPSLSDALADPGDAPYSPEALERFALLADELRHLRSYVGEPLLDLLRRIIDVTGIDVELASSVSPTAGARRDNLELFVKAVADFSAIDGQVTLSSLMAWLTAEDDFGTGLDAATPTEADSVKLLTVHRAKGLEYSAVFLVGVGDKKFPVETLRSQWTSRADVLPAPLRGDRDDVPQVRGHGEKDIDPAFREEAKLHQASEELRLGYVAFTRAKHLFWVSSFVWGTTIKPIGPSSYQQTTREVMARWGVEPDGWATWEPGQTNPLTLETPRFEWPVLAQTEEALRRIEAAALVAGTADSAHTADLTHLSPEHAAIVERWDAEIERLLVEARASSAAVIDVPMPSSLSATSLAALRDDPEAFARGRARPMPRQPVGAARFGTRFHAWVEARFGQQALLDPDDLPGRGDVGIDDDDDLREVIAAFEAGPFATRVPHAVEPAFALVLDRQVIRGRIDAVYDDTTPDGQPGFLIIDWKTNRKATADSLQLALYRLAWAELTGTPIDRVRAAFVYVRTGEVVEPAELPGRSELEELLRSRQASTLQSASLTIEPDILE